MIRVQYEFIQCFNERVDRCEIVIAETNGSVYYPDGNNVLCGTIRKDVNASP